MPRLRAVRTKEEASAIPATEPIEVVLTAEGEPPPPPPEEKEKPEPKVKAKEPEVEPQEDPLEALREQLKKSQEAERIASETLAAAQQREQAALRERDETRAQSARHEQTADDARYAAVVNALGAASSEADAAQQAWESADAAGDTKAKAEAQRRLARAEANLARYEEAKENMDLARAERKDRPPVQQTRQQQDPIEQAIAQMPPGAQSWLRAHPEFVTDPRKNSKLQAAHWDVLDEGHQQFTPAYFQSLEERIGLRQKPKAEVEDDDPPPPPQRTRTVPSAPPSRDVPSPSTGRATPTRVELTAEERDIARISGLDDVTYAKGKLELERRKRSGMYQERG